MRERPLNPLTDSRRTPSGSGDPALATLAPLRFASLRSAYSQARANAHHRSAVATDTPSAAAASGVERPAKNRSFTSSAFAGSSAANRSGRRPVPAGRRGFRRSGAPVQRHALVRRRASREPAPGVVDEDAAHRLGRGREEVPGRRFVEPGRAEPQVRLVDQGGGLEGLPGRSCASCAAASRRSSSYTTGNGSSGGGESMPHRILFRSPKRERGSSLDPRSRFGLRKLVQLDPALEQRLPQEELDLAVDRRRSSSAHLRTAANTRGSSRSRNAFGSVFFGSFDGISKNHASPPAATGGLLRLT